MNFDTVLQIVKGAATAGPAFKSLLDQVLPLFSEREQDELKSAYAAAREGSDAAQADFTEAGRGR
jgi:hypothetical protein